MIIMYGTQNLENAWVVMFGMQGLENAWVVMFGTQGLENAWVVCLERMTCRTYVFEIIVLIFTIFITYYN